MERRRGGRKAEDRRDYHLGELTEKLESLVERSEALSRGALAEKTKARVLEQVLKVTRRLGENTPVARVNAATMILMDLLLAEYRGEKVSVTGLGNLSGAPASTALLKTSALEREGLVERSGDPTDARRWYVSLTDKGRETLEPIWSSCLLGSLIFPRVEIGERASVAPRSLVL